MDYTVNISFATDPCFKVKILKQAAADFKCYICMLKDKSPVCYGEFIEKKTAGEPIRCHYLCLLSSSYIMQRGQDTAGILGFTITDIRRACLKFRTNRCTYCGRSSAAIKCHRNECERYFHYICGYKNHCLSQFTDGFLSFCHEHHELQFNRSKPAFTQCQICFSDLPAPGTLTYNPISIIQAACNEDCPGGRFHRECLQRSAYAAGYWFKCPCCFEKSFIEYARRRGIFVPNRESSWEREPNAYKDLHKPACTATECLFGADQRRPAIGGARTSIIGCSVCGGQLVHEACAGTSNSGDYRCTVCINGT